MSSNTNIGNTPVNQGYVQLIHTGETGGIDGTLRTLYDGDGTASDLQIASNKVKISTELYIGSKTITEYVQDVVGDMLDTNGSHTNITATYDDNGDGAIDLVATGAISSIIGGTGIDATGSGDITIAIDSTVATLTGTQTLSNKTLASPTFTGTANGANLTLTGDLTVSGDTIFTNSNTVLIGDAILTLNADETGSPTANAGFEVERGTSANKTFIWNETDDKWTIGSETFVASTFEGNLTGNVTGNLTGNVTGDLTGSLSGGTVTSLSSPIALSEGGTGGGSAAEARTSLGVDAAGTDNSTNVTLAGSLDYITLSGQQITRNAIDLTTDVTGVLPSANLDADTAHLSGTQTFSGAKTFSSTITGSITGNAGTATKWANPREISLTGDITGVTGASGLDGSADVSIATTIANNSVALGTQTTGNYMENVSAGTGISVSHTPSEGSTATISTNDSAIVHDNLSGYVANEHIDWTTDQGATNIHAGNYTDTNQLTTFVIQDGDITNVTIDQGKYVKFQALTNGGLDIDWASSLGAGSSGDPYDLQFKIDLSNMSSLVDTLESGDNLLVYNADEGTALAPVSEIQSALNIPSASGTTDGVVTLNANGTLTGESGLTYDTSTLALTGDFNVGSGDFFVDDSAGRVGIGVVSPLTTLDVQGQSLFQGSTTPSYRGASVGAVTINNNSADSTVDFTQGLVFTDNTNNQGAWTHAGIVSVGSSGYNGNLVFGTDGDSTRNTSGITERMRIDSSGNVGIGTTNLGTNYKMIVKRATNCNLGVGLQGGELSLEAFNDAITASVPFRLYGSEFNMLGGNVGIGTASPGVKLDVAGQARTTNGMLVDNGTTAGFFTTDSDNVNFGSSTSGKGLKIFSANTERLRIVSGGDAHFDQDVIAFSTTPSDIRLKENFTKIENGLDVVSKLEGHTFNWKKGGDRLSAGFKAQEVEKILPHLVDEKKLPLKADDDKEYKILRYEEMIPYLVEAIKEQQKQIEELKNG